MRFSYARAVAPVSGVLKFSIVRMAASLLVACAHFNLYKIRARRAAAAPPEV
eukprot:SAG31_NODE_4000_length_3677_cov_4.657630_1_plen_51_part_10